MIAGMAALAGGPIAARVLATWPRSKSSALSSSPISASTTPGSPGAIRAMASVAR